MNGKSALDILVFPEEEEEDSTLRQNEDFKELCCPLCHQKFIQSETEELLDHLDVHHNLIIADLHLISDLRKYLEYWGERFELVSIQDVCQQLRTDGSSLKFILCDKISEDAQLRQRLQVDRLKYVLKTQQREREDQSFSRDCLFCPEHFVGNRAELFDHMARDHNFNVGLPDNLVFVDEFLTLIRKRMDSLHCLFCEKLFRDKIAIREHMRKKQHRKLNPKNTIYDKYYVINYLEMGKSWQAVQAEEESATSDSDSTWTDLSEVVGGAAVCLFCTFSASRMEDLVQHMRTGHRFNLDLIKEEHGLKFYLQVKLINFIRRRVYNKSCIKCQEKFPDHQTLMAHMSSTNHISQVPKIDEWDQPQYYFPTYENDNLLCILDDKENDDLCREYSVHETLPCGTVVYAEETVNIEQSILRNKTVMDSLTTSR